MSLVPVADLETESEVAVAVSLLMANDIPHLVQNRGFGGLFPGPQIGSYNSRRVLVPESRAAEARELLGVFDRPLPDAPEESAAAPQPQSQGLFARLRIICETVLLGWFIPRGR